MNGGIVAVEIWRLFNAVGATAIIFLLSRDIYKNWRTMDPKVQLLSLALLTQMVSMSIGSIERAYRRSPVGIALLLGTVSVLWILAALLFAHRRASSLRSRRGTRPPE